MSNRLYVGDTDRENGIWNWTLGSGSRFSEIKDVAFNAKSSCEFRVFVDAGAIKVARRLYHVLAQKHAWVLDEVAWLGFGEQASSQEMQSFLKWVHGKEVERLRG